jgi:protein arginine kinase
MDDAQAEDIVYLVGEGLKQFDEFTKYEIDGLSRQQATLLKERYLISPALLKSKKGAAFVSDDKAISVMVNEEDHLREQYIYKGFDLYKAYERISGIDDGLAELYDFAFDDKLGYITACPSNLGTGMRASVMMFLPGLTQNGGLKAVLPTLKENGLTVRGTFGEGSTTEGCIYQISNEQTLGVSEKDILDAVIDTTKMLCKQEGKAREEMLKKSGAELKDKCLRSFGTLTNCAILSEEELYSKLLEVRLGIALGFLQTVDSEEFENFFNDMRPTAFRISNGLERASERKCDEARAETTCTVLPELVSVVRRK